MRIITEASVNDVFVYRTGTRALARFDAVSHQIFAENPKKTG
jgi:hypothetical protein